VHCKGRTSKRWGDRNPRRRKMPENKLLPSAVAAADNDNDIDKLKWKVVPCQMFTC